MRVSLKWLKTMVDLPEEAADLDAFCDKLDMTGTGVEGVEQTGASLNNVVIGHLLTKEHHPNADTLWVTTVDVGECNLGEDGKPEPLQIVCGAQNFNAGDKIVVAMIGAELPGDVKIKKSKLRGVVSYGMNCSGRELGVSSDHEGIMILPADAPVGTPIAEYLGIGDTVLDLEITPNRPDCMSMLGMAREVGAMYGVPCHFDAPELVEGGEKAADLVKVTIDDPERCPRYTARVIKGAKIAPSPKWLAERVTAAGARPINNVVDATNYIMFELGQPLHAFDFDKLAKDADGKAHIRVRRALDGEPFTTLDEVDRTLTNDMTVIADGNAAAAGDAGLPVALAGVMGGLDSEIDDNTVNILLESATFQSGCTSRTSRNLQLFSESSARYERGVDGATCEEFSRYAASLIAEVTGGTVCEGVVDVYPEPVSRVRLALRCERLRSFIGAPITDAEIEGFLTSLGCEVSQASGNSVLDVVVPTFRPDLTREIDLYEEVLRLWGTDRVPSTLPASTGVAGGLTVEQKRTALVGSVLRAAGVNETLTYSFVPSDDVERARMESGVNGDDVVLMNPLSSDMGVMRRLLLPGLLRSVAFNQSKGVRNIHLYEVGSVFEGHEGQAQPDEPQHVACVLCGSWNEPGWNEPAPAIDFFDAKGIVENIVRELAIPKLRFKPIDAADAPWLQPGAAAKVLSGKQELGWIGLVHPEVCDAFDAEAPVVAFDLLLDRLLACANYARPYVDIPQFPAVSVDMAIIVDEEVSCQQVEQAAQSAGGKMLESVRLFDVYRDEKRIGKGLKSLAFSLMYRDPERTLKSEEVEKKHQHVMEKVAKATGGKFRD